MRIKPDLIPSKRKFSRYIATGGTTFVFEYAVFIVLVYLLMSPVWFGQAVSYVFALVVNYMLLKKWTFASPEKNSSNKSQLVKFLLLVLVNMPLTTGIIVAIESAGVEPFIAKLLVVALAACWNFIIYDKIIFRRSSEDKNTV